MWNLVVSYNIIVFRQIFTVLKYGLFCPIYFHVIHKQMNTTLSNHPDTMVIATDVIA